MQFGHLRNKKEIAENKMVIQTHRTSTNASKPTNTN